MITTNKTDIGSTVTINGKPGKVVGREDVVAYDALKRPQGPNILVRFEDGSDKWIQAKVRPE
jgi:hypothetical protein